MKKFDIIYENIIQRINERNYKNSTFKDNIRSLLKTLKDNDYITQDTDIELKTNEIWEQEGNVKTLNLDETEDALPAMRLRLKQDSDSESFSVTAIKLADPENQKEFKNDFLETIFKDVVDYIKTASIETLQSSNVIKELPPTEGPAAQPGAEESELPTQKKGTEDLIKQTEKDSEENEAPSEEKKEPRFKT